MPTPKRMRTAIEKYLKWCSDDVIRSIHTRTQLHIIEDARELLKEPTPAPAHLQMLDNVSAALETVLLTWSRPMPAADRAARERLCAEARAVCNRELRGADFAPDADPPERA